MSYYFIIHKSHLQASFVISDTDPFNLHCNAASALNTSPSEQSPEASAWCMAGWAARKKLPYLPYSHLLLQANHILEVSIGMLCFSSTSFWEKPRTKEEGGENHNISCRSSFIVLPLVLTLLVSNQLLLCSSLPHSYSNSCASETHPPCAQFTYFSF